MGRGKDKKPRKKGQTPRGVATALADIHPDPEVQGDRIAFMLDIMPSEQLDLRKVESVEIGKERMKHYLECCAKYNQPISNLGAYMAIGVNKVDVHNWTTGVYGKSNPGIVNLLKSVVNICALSRESMMMSGDLNPVVGIFWQKNFDNYTDQQQVVVTTQGILDTDVTQQALEQKYGDSIKSIE